MLIEKRLYIKCCKPGHIIPNCPESKSLSFPEYLKAKPEAKPITPRQPQVNNVETEEGEVAGKD